MKQLSYQIKGSVRRIERVCVFPLLLLLLAAGGINSGCNVDKDDMNADVIFVRQKPVNGEREVMQALLGGELVLEGRCLKVVSMPGNEGYVVIWPPDFSLREDDGRVTIVNELGEVVGRVGEPISMGGGAVTSNEFLDPDMREALGDECPGPFWIVGTIEPLAESHPVDASDEYDIEVAVRNAGPLRFDSITVQFPTEGMETEVNSIDYGPLDPGDTSRYVGLPIAYGYAYVRVSAGDKTYTFHPIDYVGEKPLPMGKHIYAIKPGDGESLELILEKGSN